jgi:hypothetical protein
MFRIRRYFLAVAAVGLISMAVGSAVNAQNGSTPGERAHWVALTHKLESDPFNEVANGEAEDAMRRLVVVDDLMIPICGSLFDELADKSYKYGSQVARQYMLASASFIIEHPDKARDETAMNLAGAESALKLYTAIAKQKPDERSKKLDDLLKEQTDGTLSENVQKGCGAQK